MRTMTRRPVTRKTEFGRKLTERRKAKKLTQEEAAAKAGVTRKTWAAWERGDHKPHRLFLPIIKRIVGKL